MHFSALYYDDLSDYTYQKSILLHDELPQPKYQVYEEDKKSLEKAKRKFSKKSCGHCGQRVRNQKSRKRVICEGCTAVYYCSEKCKKKNREQHSSTCNTLMELQERLRINSAACEQHHSTDVLYVYIVKRGTTVTHRSILNFYSGCPSKPVGVLIDLKAGIPDSLSLSFEKKKDLNISKDLQKELFNLNISKVRPTGV